MNHPSVVRRSLLATLSLATLVSGAACSGGEEGGDDAMPDAACATQKFYPDTDGDGFGDMTKAVDLCAAPVGYIAKGGDCRDGDPSSHPGAVEICDTFDNDCNGLADDADGAVDKSTATTFYRDADGDGFGTQTMVRTCAKPAGFAAVGNDCNDASASVNPGAPEICDGIDNDCDALVDAADASLDPAMKHAYYLDADHDNYGTGAATFACSPPTNYVAAAGDCNDANATAHPGGTEVCDGADNDCDGGTDGTAAAPNQCAALVGTYTGTYTHHTDERVGSTIVNQMNCNGTGSGALVLGRSPALQGTFTCAYAGSLGGFMHNQTVTLKASVDPSGHVTGTVDHVYDSPSTAHRVYNVTGTQTGTTLTLSGTGSWLPNPMSAVPWGVTFSFAASR